MSDAHDKVSRRLAKLMRAMQRIAGQRTSEEHRAFSVGEGHATGLEDDDQLADYVDAYDRVIEEAREAMREALQ